MPRVVLPQVRAPTRPHPEAANLPPFNETAFAAAKQVDVALDQARMPSLVPTAGEHLVVVVAAKWQRLAPTSSRTC
jgi:hypothetical protein